MRTSLPGMLIRRGAGSLVALGTSACSSFGLVAPLDTASPPAADTPGDTDPAAETDALRDTAAVLDTFLGSDPGGTAVCGNGVRQGTEECDGADFGGTTCQARGFPFGELACQPGCVIDASGCTNDHPGGTWCVETPATIPTRGTVTSVGTLPETGPIRDVHIEIQGRHTFISDLVFEVVHLGVTVRLADVVDGCLQGEDIDVVFGDTLVGDPTLCDASGLTGTRAPEQALAGFSGLDMGGDWTLRVIDTLSFDGGTIDRWCVTINP